MVYRIYVEKKPGFDVEAEGLKNELVSLLGIQSLSGVRLLNRYDVEGIDEALFHHGDFRFRGSLFRESRRHQERRTENQEHCDKAFHDFHPPPILMRPL